MKKQYLIVTLIATLLILVSCNSDIATNNEILKLDNLKTPDRLEIFSPDLNKKNQELATEGLEILDLMKNSDNLSDEEIEELEERIANHQIELDKYRNQTIIIDSKEVVENIFNKIGESTGVYDRYLSKELLKNSDYYYVKVFYEGIDLHAQNVQDGYISIMYIFKDNNLIFFDKFSDGESESREIKVDFNYEWLKEQVE